jgi:hypothetical protein
MREIVTQILLPFGREQVWAVLTDLRRYADWNPLNLWADGEAAAGALVPMKFIDPGHPGKTLSGRVRMTIVDPPSRLEWVGRLLPPLFTGRHFFNLTARGGETELIHGERLSGLLPAMWSDDRMAAQRRAYEKMNEALARRLGELSRPQIG